MTDDTNNESVEALKAENEALAAELEQSRKSGGGRMYAAMALVVLFAISLALTNHAVWLTTTLLNTDQFVDTLAPLPEDDAVAAAIAQRFAEGVVEANDIEGVIAAELPDGLAFISVPLTEGITGVIANASTAIIQSDVFTTIWEKGLTVVHSTALFIVDRANEGAVQIDEGDVVLDLNPLVDEVDAALQERGIDVLSGEDIDASIVLYETDSQGVVQSIVTLIYSIRWAAPILSLVLLIGAVLVATDRRKVTVWLGIGSVIAMALVLIELRLLRNQLSSGVTEPVYLEGFEAAWNIIFDRFLAQTWAVLLLGLVVAGAAYLMGPSQRATAIRSRFEGSQEAPQDGALVWVASHLRAVQWAIVAIGALVLLVIPSLTVAAVVVTAVVVIGAVLLLQYLAGAPADG